MFSLRLNAHNISWSPKMSPKHCLQTQCGTTSRDSPTADGLNCVTWVYHHWMQVFIKQDATKLPPYQHSDYIMDLLPRVTVSHFHIFPCEQTGAMMGYIQEKADVHSAFHVSSICQLFLCGKRMKAVFDIYVFDLCLRLH